MRPPTQYELSCAISWAFRATIVSDPRELLTADAATWAGYAFKLGATSKLVHVAPEICAGIYRGVTAVMQFGVLVVLFLGTMV